MPEENSNLDATTATDSSRPPSFSVKKGDRQLFHVELRPGETTTVSWKKLLKDANKGSTSAPEPLPKINPALEARIAPGQSENQEHDAPQTNRFSAVVEKIERLYMGNDSSDEEDLLVVPDDQYDTEDSFIDDTELDEYFEVDNSAIKHDGFFVNRGKLERINEPPVLPNPPAKKRSRKDTLKNTGKNIDGHASKKHVKVGKTAAGKTASLPMKNTFNSSQNLAVPGEHHKDLKPQNQLEISGITLKKKTDDIRPTSDPSVCLKVSNNDVPSVVEAKDADKQKTGALQSKNRVDEYKDASGVHDTSHQKCQETGVHLHSKSQPGRTPSSTADLENTGRSKDKIGVHGLPDLNLSVGKSVNQTPKSKIILKQDCSSVRPKSEILEKAIQELEKIVAESRPPTVGNQEVDSTSQAIKRRIPREVKLKLAKVVRLAHVSQGKVSQELINRLKSILGHLMQLRTLKRNLKNMSNVYLSPMKEKDDRFQQKKKEVIEMIKMQAPSIESEKQQQAGASVGQELGPDGKAISKRSFSMDTALEDKICDLYDLFVDGLDETAGPQIRKFYVELAQLWPNGCMDNHGIKHAICRAKERRGARQNTNKDQEKINRTKLSAPKLEDKVIGTYANTHTVTDVRVLNPPVNAPEKEKTKGSSSCSPDDVRFADVRLHPPPVKAPKKGKTRGSSNSSRDDVGVPNVHSPVNAPKKGKNRGSSSSSLDDVRVGDVRVLNPPVNAPRKEKTKGSSRCSLDDVRVTDVRVLRPPVNAPKKEKTRGSSICSSDDVKVADGVLIKKVKKRKTEHVLEGTHSRPKKLASSKEEERPMSLKQSASPKSNLQPTSLHGLA